MFRKLRNKFLFLNMIVTSLVMMTAFGIVYLTTYSNTKADIERRLNNVSGSFVIYDSEKPAVPGSESSKVVNGRDKINTSHKVTSDYTPSFVITVDKTGNVLEINSLIDIPEDEYIEAAYTAWNQKNSSTINIAERTWIYKISPVEVTRTTNGQITQTEFPDIYQILFLDITDMLKNLNDLLFTFLFVGIGMLIVIFLISIFYANRSIRPISESWAKQKQFIADASHELKTPLTTIMTNCDVLEANENETIKSQREWLGYIKVGADRMNKLVNSLLTLARVEGLNLQTSKQSFDIAALVCDVMQSMEAATIAKKLNIDRKIEFVGDIYGYEDSVRQVFTILYENAVKYVNEGGNINVSVRRTKKGVSCTVKNTGKGIPAKDLPYVFDRFYRSDTARSNEENSYGLGLAIAKSIVEQIGGKITVKSVENEWTEFTFMFEV
jgi:two-component system sensor histidine kinase CiaH